MTSLTIEAAREMRANGKVQPAILYYMAEDEAANLLARFDGFNGVAGEVSVHLDRKGLEGSIYRHAMHEAGAVVQRDGRPFISCSYCGYKF